MPLLVGPETLDTTSENGPCKYFAKVVAGPQVSPNIFINGQPIKFYHNGTIPDTVEGVPNSPIPCPIPVTFRKVVATKNTSVFFNNLLPAVEGDSTELTSFPGTKRLFVGPFQYPTVFIGKGVA